MNPSRITNRAAGISRSFGPPSRAISRALVCARTMPATELTSATANPSIPSSAARSMYSSGWDAPVRKVKLLSAPSSVKAMGYREQRMNILGQSAGFRQ